MSATAVRESIPATTIRAQGGGLTGTGTLARFILRQERFKLPGWLLGMSVLFSIFLNALNEITSTEEQRQDIRRIMEGTVGAIFGPGYGREAITAERYVVGVYGLFFFILAALMSMLLVSRHTRGEEQSGRAELVRSSVVGRYAHLTSVLLVAAAANALLAVMLAGVTVVHGLDGGDGLLFGAGVAAVGMIFAGITAITVQVTEYSRTATGIAGALLGVAWAIRAAGDMIGDYGSPLSWFSPLAWSNQTRPYVDARWWPLLLSAGLIVLTVSAAYVLLARRDVGAGLIAARRGAPVAPTWLNSPVAAAFRLQRGSLLWWTASLSAFGFVFGALGEEVADPDAISERRIEMFGGSVETLFDGYLGVIALFIAVVSGIMAILGMQAARAEETEGRAEPVLATATSRWAWLGGYLVVIALGVVGLLAIAGFATGAGAALAASDSSYLLDVTGAYVAHAPAVLVLLGASALLFGLAPKALGVVWVVLGYSLFTGLFGTTMDLPQWALNLSPFEHVGRPPLDSVSWLAVASLLGIAGGLMLVGLAGFRRRDLETK